MSRIVRSTAAVDYPCSDDRPMAESEVQLIPMLYLLTVLRTHFRERPDVYVGGDMFLYYEEGNPGAVVTPSVFVALGVAKRADDPRESYKLWEERKVPDFVLEVIWPSTWATDRDEKRALYASLGVAEYWLHDPTGEHLASRLRGMSLVGRSYRDLPRTASEPGVRSLYSAVLGLEVRVERGGALRLRAPATATVLLGHEEEHAAREAAEFRAGQEAAARRAAEVRAGQEATARRAEAAAREAAEFRAGQEAAAREAAEVQVAELQAQLRELRSGELPPRDPK